MVDKSPRRAVVRRQSCPGKRPTTPGVVDPPKRVVMPRDRPVSISPVHWSSSGSRAVYLRNSYQIPSPPQGQRPIDGGLSTPVAAPTVGAWIRTGRRTRGVSNRRWRSFDSYFDVLARILPHRGGDRKIRARTAAAAEATSVARTRRRSREEISYVEG